MRISEFGQEFDFEKNMFIDNSVINCYKGGGGGGSSTPQAEYKYRLLTPEEKLQMDLENNAPAGTAITLDSKKMSIDKKKYQELYNKGVNRANALFNAEVKRIEKANSQNDDDVSPMYRIHSNNKPTIESFYNKTFSQDWFKKEAVNATARNEMQKKARKIAVTDPVEMESAGSIAVVDEQKIKPRRSTSRLNRAVGSKKSLKSNKVGLKL